VSSRAECAQHRHFVDAVSDGAEAAQKCLVFPTLDRVDDVAQTAAAVDEAVVASHFGGGKEITLALAFEHVAG